MRSKSSLLAAFVLAAATGCGTTTAPPAADAGGSVPGADATAVLPDASANAGFDGSVEPVPDGSVQPGADASVEPGVDGSVGPGADASVGLDGGASGADGSVGPGADASVAGPDAGACTGAVACGKNNACQRACSNGVLGACLPAGASSVDLLNDADNCGECGNACPDPSNALAVCRNGACGRGPCEAGWFDIDGTATFGCESTCTGRVCTKSGGGTVTLSNDPLPERSVTFSTFVNSSSVGGAVQTSAQHTNMGAFGQGGPQGAVKSQGGNYQNIGGFFSTMH